MPQRTPSNIRRVMTDRASLVRRTLGPRVRGESQIVEVQSVFFPCRIDPANGTEVGRAMRKELTLSHTMITNLDYADGTPLVIKEQDQVTIERGSLGSTVYEPYATFEITGVVMVPRSLRKVLLQVFPIQLLTEF
jgi:hypothetical protein